MALVHLFCFTIFFKFTFSKKFFNEIEFFGFFFGKTKNITMNPLYGESKGPNIKVRDPTFIRPKFDVRRPSL